MAACLFQLVFRSCPAGHIVARRPGLVGEARHKGAICISPGGRKFHRTVIIHSVRPVIRIGEVLLANLDSAHLCLACRAVQRDIIGCIGAEAGGNGACCAVKDDGLAACGIGAVLQGNFRQQADGGGLHPITVCGFYGMDILFVAFDLDLVLGRCHRFRFGSGQLFHDHHIVVIDTVSHIDETVVIRITKSIRTNGMIPGISSIIRISLYMAKRNRTLCIGHCLIPDGRSIGHIDSGLVASCKPLGGILTGAPAGNAHGIHPLHSGHHTAQSQRTVAAGYIVSAAHNGGPVTGGFIGRTATDGGLFPGSLILITTGYTGKFSCGLILLATTDAGVQSRSNPVTAPADTGILAGSMVLGPTADAGIFSFRMIDKTSTDRGILTRSLRRISAVGTAAPDDLPACCCKSLRAGASHKEHRSQTQSRRCLPCCGQTGALFLSSPFGQLRHHHIAVPDPAPDHFINMVHKRAPFCISMVYTGIHSIS